MTMHSGQKTALAAKFREHAAKPDFLTRTNETAGDLLHFALSFGFENPYLEIFRVLRPRYDKNASWLLHEDDPILHVAGFAFRNYFVNQFAWAVPDDEALAALAELGPIVEVGAGTGYWAWLLKKRGVDVLALDRDPPRIDRGIGHNHWHVNVRKLFPVKRGIPSDLGEHADRALFLCWPPYSESMAAECLEHYRGENVAYVGEGPGGCTADDAFHEHLARDFRQVTEVEIPQWYGIHDRLTIWERKR